MLGNLRGLNRMGNMGFDVTSLISPLTGGITAVLGPAAQAAADYEHAQLQKGLNAQQQQILAQQQAGAIQQQAASIVAQQRAFSSVEKLIGGAALLAAVGFGGYVVYKAIRKR